MMNVKWLGWCLVWAQVAAAGMAAEDTTWPPSLPGAENGTLTLTSDLFLKVPAAVSEQANAPGAAGFTMAATPPAVDLAYHGQLPDRALNGTGWSAWGDIAVADDGRVYVGLGDHGDTTGGTSRAFIYRWDPATKTLKQVVDLNAIVAREQGEPTWSKVHARIDEGADGNIYFSGTLNDGNRANRPAYRWSQAVPGGQLYQYDPRSDRARVFTNLPLARATATSLLDRRHNVWWCNLEAGSNALLAIDLRTAEVLYQAPNGSMGFNRNFALAHDGRVYFNGRDAIWKCDPVARAIVPTRSAFPESKGMRSSTRESAQGHIYGTTYSPGRLFRYTPATDELLMLGPDFLTGNYTTVCVLSPDERFLYYLPGAHGGARKIGTPVVQYDIATGQRKVIAFLREAIEGACNYVPAGTYGTKLSADGGTLYVNFNGHAANAIRPGKMRPTGFGLTSFAAIYIPASER